MSSPSTTVVSASGKVLIAGGYLVLDPKYSGVVVSTSSRFYTVVQSGNRKSSTITVKSPQFRDAVWNYEVAIGADTIDVSRSEGYVSSLVPTTLLSLNRTSKNKFVYIALQQTLKLVSEIKGFSHLKDALSNGLDVTIVGGNDFYSQRAKVGSMHIYKHLHSH